MATSTLTSKGQITLPREVRERLGVGPGDVIDFVADEDGDVHVRRAGRDVSDLRGFLRRPGRRPVSLSEMDRVIRRARNRR